MTEGRYLLPSDPAQVLARHGAILTAAAHQRVRMLVWAAAALLFTAFAVWWLGIAFDQLGSGLAQLGNGPAGNKRAPTLPVVGDPDLSRRDDPVADAADR